MIGTGIDTHGSASDRCTLDSDYPGGVIDIDVGLATAYRTVFPAGRYCLWLTYDGAVAGVEQTGWVRTWIALAFLVLACVAVLALVRTEWWVPAVLGLLIPILGWVVMIVTSDTIVSPVFWPELPSIPHRPG